MQDRGDDGIDVTECSEHESADDEQNAQQKVLVDELANNDRSILILYDEIVNLVLSLNQSANKWRKY